MRKHEERERDSGDSLNTDGIRRRMINYWYLVATGEWCVGLDLFFFFFFYHHLFADCNFTILSIINFFLMFRRYIACNC